MKIDKKIKILDFKLSKILNGGLFGAYKSKFSGSGMEFSEHRQYHFGDHVKNIDWKASSKTNEMFIKNYEEERDLNVLFFLDNTDSMEFGSNIITKKDLLIEIFYSLSLSAYYNNDNVGGAILYDSGIHFIDYKKSKNNIYKIIDSLVVNILKKDENNYGINKFHNIFTYLNKHKINNNLIFILTDNIEKIDEKILMLSSSQNDIVIINIFDYFENNVSDLLEHLVVTNNNSFINIDLSNDFKRNKYIDERKKKIDYFKNTLDKNNIGYIKVDTKSDIFKELIGYFSKV